MTFVMEEYESFDLMDIRLFRADAVVLEANSIANLIQQSGLGICMCFVIRRRILGQVINIKTDLHVIINKIYV